MVQTRAVNLLYARAHHTQKLDHRHRRRRGQSFFNRVVIVRTHTEKKDSISVVMCPGMYSLRPYICNSPRPYIPRLWLYIYIYTKGEISHSLLPPNNISTAFVHSVPHTHTHTLGMKNAVNIVQFRVWFSAIYNLQYTD